MEDTPIAVPEVVPAEAVAESPEAEGETPEEPTTPTIDETTWKKRLAGKDQALTNAQKERDALKAEADALRKWKAEKEEADMTEMEKLTRRIAQQEAELAAARSEVQRERLARQFPLAAEFFGEEPLPSETVLTSLEAKLKAQAGEPEQPEPYIDPNNPRRTPKAPVPAKRSKADAIADLMNAELPELTR